jgi:hypothetical protein
VEQSVIGGTAHLLSFEGSDTMSACYYAQASCLRQACQPAGRAPAGRRWACLLPPLPAQPLAPPPLHCEASRQHPLPLSLPLLAGRPG